MQTTLAKSGVFPETLSIGSNERAEAIQIVRDTERGLAWTVGHRAVTWAQARDLVESHMHRHRCGPWRHEFPGDPTLLSTADGILVYGRLRSWVYPEDARRSWKVRVGLITWDELTIALMDDPPTPTIPNP